MIFDIFIHILFLVEPYLAALSCVLNMSKQCFLRKIDYITFALLKSNQKSVVYHGGGKKRSIPFRRQRMQIDELIPPSSTSAYPVSQPDDPYIADLLQLADGRFVFFVNSQTVLFTEVA